MANIAYIIYFNEIRGVHRYTVGHNTAQGSEIGRISNDYYMPIVPMKEFRKLVYIWRTYVEEFGIQVTVFYARENFSDILVFPGFLVLAEICNTCYQNATIHDPATL